jgi:hypothetical protein
MLLADEEEGRAEHAGGADEGGAAKLQEGLDRGHKERSQNLAESKDNTLQKDEGAPVLLVRRPR